MDSYRAFFTLAEVLGLIVVITIGLVAANTAAMSIRERRAEIAVMRSMGFTSRLILGLLLAESLIIGLLGGVLGCGARIRGAQGCSRPDRPRPGRWRRSGCRRWCWPKLWSAAALIGLLSALIAGARGGAAAISSTRCGWWPEMAIPLKYNFRSLLVRRVSTLMTGGGIALVVAVFVVVMAMVAGLAGADPRTAARPTT